MNLQKSIELLRRDAAVIVSKQHLLYFPIAVDLLTVTLSPMSMGIDT